MALPFFAVTLFVSAFLLFLVQPMIGKLILPRLGGTPQVWNTCMVFFQSALLAGYAYTHTVSTRFNLRRQLLVHGILLLAPFFVLFIFFPSPFSISGFEPPRGANPITYTLLFLLLIVGLPFFVVSTSAPLLQKWFAGTDHPSAKDPYFLYGASNLGSMLALLFYPLMVEPLLTLHVQTWTWAIGYVVLVGLILGCVALVWKSPLAMQPAGAGLPDQEPSAEMPVPPPPPPKPVDPTPAIQTSATLRKSGKKKGGPKINLPQPLQKHEPEPVRSDEMTVWRRLRWIMLAFAPSSLMLGVTSYMSTDLSPIPLFWVLPLSLYLLSFILVFLRYPIPWTEMPHRVMGLIQPVFICLLCVILVTRAMSPEWPTSLTLVAFFFTAMVCHGELARDRPGTQHLTEFFLWMSLGGMLGGVFNGLIAPVLFTTGVVEYPIAIVIACLLRPQTKESGWSDQYLSDTFPGLIPAIQEWGKKLAAMSLQSYAILVVAVGALWCGLVYAISDSLERPFLVQVLYFVGIIAVLSLIWIRFRTKQAFPLIVDMVLGLFVFCLAYFLTYNSAGWGWKETDDPEKNPLARFFKGMGLPVSWVIDAYGQSGIAVKGLVFGIPLLFAFSFLNRPLRFGLAIGGVLLANLFWAERARTLLNSDRSYFGILRVQASASAIYPEEMMELLQITSQEDLIKRKNIMDSRAKDTEGDIYFFAPYTTLSHGTTLHGENYQFPELSRLATTYYHRFGPTGIIMERLNWFNFKYDPVTQTREWTPQPPNTYHADARLPTSLIALGAATMGVPLPTAQLVAAWSEPPYATIGLGTGTMASYGRPFQHVTFYEIDAKVRNFHLPPDKSYYSYFDLPKVQRVTLQNRDNLNPDLYPIYYDYLYNAIKRGCNLEVIMGDARQSLEKEDSSPAGMNPKRENYYRVMEIDAFSSDAIPVHLITEEAIKLYFSKLHEEGVVCVHTSNRHVDLVQPVTDIAVKLGIKYRVGKDDGRRRSHYRGHGGSEYVMLARDDKYLPKNGEVVSEIVQKLAKKKNVAPQPYMIWSTPRNPGNTVWTDDYSNMVGILRDKYAFTILLGLLAGIGAMVAIILLYGKSQEKK